MGVDLKALATHFRERRGEFLPTAILRFDRDEGLFAQLARDAVPCLVHPLPADLKVGCYEDTGLTYQTVDRNGDPLTFTTSADLLRIRVPGDIAEWNRVILAFLTALPPDARIILYWF